MHNSECVRQSDKSESERGAQLARVDDTEGTLDEERKMFSFFHIFLRRHEHMTPCSCESNRDGCWRRWAEESRSCARCQELRGYRSTAFTARCLWSPRRHEHSVSLVKDESKPPATVCRTEQLLDQFALFHRKTGPDAALNTQSIIPLATPESIVQILWPRRLAKSIVNLEVRTPASVLSMVSKQWSLRESREEESSANTPSLLAPHLYIKKPQLSHSRFLFFSSLHHQ
jgi:hypothetical protein